MEAALSKATKNARKEVAAALDTVLAQETQAFTDSLGDALTQSFSEARKAAADTLATERAPKEKEVFQKDNGTWRAFVLMEMPIDKMARALLSALEGNEKLQAKFRDGRVYKELSEASETRNRNPADRSQER